ncbi:MAG: VWA domain-containing protein [Gammaproteobacteria bacterium]|nr:VWA domain-containing protein [Gammaproteobacteria bacterium]
MQKAVVAICLIVLHFSAELNAGDKISDVRVLIDVSGSMKKTDPSNLRVPAVKLLNGLIPNGSKAGIWTFGRYVNMTVKWGAVNDQWRKRADLGAEKIHSNALLTNIESALKRASKGWEKADIKTHRHLILLTDGQVDISKDTAKNALSRQHILDKSLKKLTKNGVKVHAIALSKDTDEVLLKRLALETNGSFEIAETAARLQKIFFKMFERAVQPDTVSLQNNQFTIDSEISEMTLLVFRIPGSKPTRLFTPRKSSISAERPGNSTWRSDSGYDLITVKKPSTGVWSIDADIDPDSRVMVVTNLKLDVSGLPVYVTPNEKLKLSTALFNKGKQISKNSFLRFVDFKLLHQDLDGKKNELPLKHSKVRKEKGQYQYLFEQGLTEGEHSIMVSADSRTFSRNKRIDLSVQWPVKVKINPDGEPGNYALSIAAREEYLKPKSLQVAAMLEAPDKSSKALIMKKKSAGWLSKIATTEDGVYQALIKVEAETQTGKMVKYDLGGFSMVGVKRQAKGSEASEVTEVRPSGQTETTPEIAEIEPVVDDSSPDWVLTSIIVGVSNLLMIALGLGIILYIRRQKATTELTVE